MADWVHCNKCFTQPSAESSCAFQLTSCGHILCKKCYDYSQEVCKRAAKPLHCYCCSKGPIRVMGINSSMDKKTRQFFMDISQLWQEKVAKMSKICQFQSQQVQSLVRFARIRESEIKQLKNKTEQMEKNLQQIKHYQHHQQQLQNRSYDPSSFRKPYFMAAESQHASSSANPNRSYMNHSLQVGSTLSSSGFKTSGSRLNTSGSRLNTSGGRLNTSGGSVRLVSLDSPVAFAGRNVSAMNTSTCSDSARSSSITPILYQPPTTTALKPTILASYSTTSSTSSRGSSSAARSVLMPGRITMGNIVPSSSKNLLNQSLKY